MSADMMGHCLYCDQGQYQSAINHLQRVLEISGEMGDHVGDADAFGTIADIYTDMGDLESVRRPPSHSAEPHISPAVAVRNETVFSGIAVVSAPCTYPVICQLNWPAHAFLRFTWHIW